MKNVKISVLGTASWVPKTRISSRELVGVLNTGKPLNWVDEKLGIRERALAVSLPDLKPIRNGAPSCASVSEKICRELFTETDTNPEEIEHLILASCTPDELNFKFTTTELHKLLGLKHTTRVHEIPSGCTGLVEALDTANAYLRGSLPMGSKVLIVAVNLTSPFFADWNRYVEQKEWLSAVIFSDGACALLLQTKESKEDSSDLLVTFFEVDGSRPLMHFPAGGVLNPTMADNADRHLYSMNAREVALYYRTGMVRNFERLEELYPKFEIRRCKRIYLHQASPKAVEAFRISAQLSEEQVPLAGEYLGNSAGAVTGIMFDQDLKTGIVKKGDLVLFSVVGAGAINGVALLRV